MVSPNLRGWTGTWEGDRSFSRKSLRARQAQPKLKSAQARQAPAAAAHHHRWFPKYRFVRQDFQVRQKPEFAGWGRSPSGWPVARAGVGSDLGVVSAPQ